MLASPHALSLLHSIFTIWHSIFFRHSILVPPLDKEANTHSLAYHGNTPPKSQPDKGLPVSTPADSEVTVCLQHCVVSVRLLQM